MKVLQFILLLVIMINFMKISRSEDGLELIAMKRPFCNAFTGCGRKRNPVYVGPSYRTVQQVSLPMYQALLRFSAGRIHQRQGQDEPEPRLFPVF